jgi:diacylglycerol kinase family enzyme
MRATLLHNPSAGTRKVKAAELMRLLRRAGLKPIYQSTDEKNWRSALREPTDLVIAAGGDGTVAKVAEEMRGKTAVLAILPLGSANNIATGLGIRGKPGHVIRRWAQFVPRRFDFWRCSGPWGKHVVIEGCGIGAISEAGANLDAADANSLGRTEKLALARKFIRGLVRKAKPFKLKARCDGKEIKGEFPLFEALNMGIAGPGLQLVRGADPFDGKLDVLFVRPENRKAFLDWLDRGARRSWATRPSVRCRRLRLERKRARLRLGDNQFWPEGDGSKKLGAKRYAEITRQRRTVTVLAPKGPV